MHWWKLSKIDSFEDRNNINERIVKLQALVDVLKYAAKLVFMTQRGAKRMVADVRDNKTLSSYESITDFLTLADRCALDAPDKFALFCNRAAIEIENKVSELEEARVEFTEKTLPHRMKGWRDE